MKKCTIVAAVMLLLLLQRRRQRLHAGGNIDCGVAHLPEPSAQYREWRVSGFGEVGHIYACFFPSDEPSFLPALDSHRRLPTRRLACARGVSVVSNGLIHGCGSSTNDAFSVRGLRERFLSERQLRVPGVLGWKRRIRHNHHHVSHSDHPSSLGRFLRKLTYGTH